MNIDVVYEVCNRLLKWDALKSIGVKDILVDPSTLTIGLWGDPLKFENGVLKHGLNNYNFHLNNSFGELFGIRVETERWPNSYQVRSTSPMWFHAEKDETLADFLQEMNYAVRDAVDTLSGKPMSKEEPDFIVTLIPAPGYPYTPGKTKEIYSAKLKKIETKVKPPWLLKVKDREGIETYGVNFCLLAPRLCSEGPSVVGRFPNRDLEYVVTHATRQIEMTKQARLTSADQGSTLSDCNGMLYPSLAVGLIPATNFGETVLVTKPNIPLFSMKPYKERGSFKTVTYNTDVWTDVTTAFLNDYSIAAFEQLHGHENYIYSSHMLVLGPQIKEEGFADEAVKPIESTTKLAAALQKKYRVWTRDLSVAKFDALSESMSGIRYGYLETKVNGILSWDCFPLAVCPAAGAKAVHDSLRGIGFRGDLITVETSADLVDSYTGKSKLKPKEYEYLQYQYAWQVRDAILAYASTKDFAFFSVQE